jgi:hypothetical protein
MKWFRSISFIIGLLLLLAAVVGELSAIIDYENKEVSEKQIFVPSLASTIKSVDQLFNFIAGENKASFMALSEKERMEKLFHGLNKRIIRGDSQHTLFTNWIMASLRIIRHDLPTMRDSDNMLRFGSEAICSQAAHLLMTLARKAGMKARHVGLYGHVVMEAWYDSDWHMFDADQEIIPIVDGEVLSVEELALNSVALKQYYGYSNSLVEVISSRQNHTYANHNGAQFVWSAQVLMLLERGAFYLKFAIPLLFILLGIWQGRSPIWRQGN